MRSLFPNGCDEASARSIERPSLTHAWRGVRGIEQQAGLVGAGVEAAVLGAVTTSGVVGAEGCGVVECPLPMPWTYAA
eukprot:6206858-Pleurochrysis_carterae.AAC.5